MFGGTLIPNKQVLIAPRGYANCPAELFSNLLFYNACGIINI